MLGTKGLNMKNWQLYFIVGVLSSISFMSQDGCAQSESPLKSLSEPILAQCEEGAVEQEENDLEFSEGIDAPQLDYREPFAYEGDGNSCWDEGCCFDNEYECNWLFPNYFYAGYTGGRGIGYRSGYTTIGVFSAPAFLAINQFQGFVDAKGYAFNEGKWGSSVGGGLRWYSPLDVVVGANAYYDYRRFHRYDFSQLGIGFEVLGSRWEFRVNGYIPVGKRADVERRVLDFSDDYFAVRRKRYSQWGGFDAEIGAWVRRKTVCNWYGLFVGAGPYYYSRDRKYPFEDRRHADAWGGRVRLLARICDYVDLSVSVTHDPVWHTRAQGQITVAIPFSGNWLEQRSNSCSCDCACNCFCAIEPVQRNGIIPADEKCCWLWNWSEEGCSCGESVSNNDSFSYSGSCSPGYRVLSSGHYSEFSSSFFDRSYSD